MWASHMTDLGWHTLCEPISNTAGHFHANKGLDVSYQLEGLFFLTKTIGFSDILESVTRTDKSATEHGVVLQNVHVLVCKNDRNNQFLGHALSLYLCETAS